MAEEEPTAPEGADVLETDAPEEELRFRDEDGAITREFYDAITAAVEARDAEQVRALAGDLHEADAADILVALHADDRAPFVSLLGKDFDFAALTEVDEQIRVAVLEELPTEVVVEGMRELDSDDAVYILEDLDEAAKAEILEQLPIPDRLSIQRSLDYPEETAGRRMQTDFIAVASFWTVGQTIDFLRNQSELPDDFYEIFVIDPAFRLAGTVPLNKILRAKRQTRIADVMNETSHPVLATEDQEEVARLFERYNLVSTAVVDEGGRLVGVLTIDDMVDVMKQEAEEDLRALAGVGDEEISDSVTDTVRSRFIWLLVNLATAILASMVISLFDGAISKMVALAVLMPIVASMGGNAGSQTMTVAVRALATREIDRRNMVRTIVRETTVGAINGVLFAVLIGIAAGLWFEDVLLGVIIGAALIINLVVAGLAGILIPLALDRLEIDPAVASSVFVTTVTDVVGFSAFLGLATWFLTG
ncbi:Magnesium transporter MgtE [Hartmannibacter diazotrophicus]|uniref:Magnesium transporter MgtE n=1 Tax=Hartmannibacter diazotrophicus TaxID=1482074 RepID=A0A2C9D458_9HYPH|nr:magnesium transporter [Hartmannibacter diazotrophicus]SON55117.1 Magnesium transporter MgtE [Hartmannibacter diazotrophicus]